jgi:hypothetical protein
VHGQSTIRAGYTWALSRSSKLGPQQGYRI